MFHFLETFSANDTLSCSILVPFCYTVDLSAPSNIIEDPATSPQTTGTASLHPPAADAPHYTHIAQSFATHTLTVKASETADEKQNLSVTDGKTAITRNKNISHIAGVLLNVANSVESTSISISH